MTRARSLLLPLAAALLIVAGCVAPMAGSGGAPASMASMAAPEPVAGQISVANVRARPAPLEGGNGAAFMVVLNGTDAPVRFASATGDIAAAIELHETTTTDGIMKMVPQPDGFEIPAGGSVELMPGGKHVMLIGLTHPLEAGQAFSLTLQFDNGTNLDVSVPVVEMDGMPGMNMGGESMGEGERQMGGMPAGDATPTSQP